MTVSPDTARRAVQAGQPAPSFRLPELQGGSRAMVDLIDHGPLVISFYRGLWCSFCAETLDALAQIDGEIGTLGASQVVIGPKPADRSQRRRLNDFPMPVLLDQGGRVAAAYGLSSIPATYLLDRRGYILLAAIALDYRNRLPPDQILSALRCLRRRTEQITSSE